MKGKRILAVLGILVLLGAVIAPMIAAFGTAEGSADIFRASLGAAIIVPVLAYVLVLTYRVLSARRPEPDSKIKNIVFDVGRVLVDFDWEGYLASFGFPKEEEEVIAREVFKDPLWNERDRGLLSEEEYVELFVSHAPQYADDIRAVMKDSYKTIRPRDYAKDWTGYLRSRGYHLYVLSNYADDPLQKTIQVMDFLQNMDGVIWSYQEKKIKPEKEFFEVLLSRYHLKPEETVFLDDREDNCEGARRVGIHAIVFKDLKQGAAELEKLGVK